ncbi:AdoMet-dependent rRNA methyltransferase spb1 [Elasticomyces elasticus]|nr:AdoMet-dependent rRNA methyltransferase spb1 [Elasticomyces elasticus]
MAIQKKHGKGRLDKFYYLAKEKGYRARAAFKLIQLNKKYSFLQNSRCLIDLCAAPGSWLQVAAETMPVNSLIVGVDLAPIKPVPRTITFQDDITTDRCRATIRGHLKTWKADTVVHDGAPNVGTAWVQDSFSQNDLVLSSMKLATEFLVPGGTFVTKVFRSRDSSKLEWIFKQLFTKVEQTKPPSSRNVSAETFYVCRGYKAPKHLDPKFLDPKYAFAEVADAAPNNEAKVFNPEQKKRKRDGYAEGDYTQFHDAPASEFIQTSDPIAMLGSLNKLSFEQEHGGNGDLALAALEKMPETTREVRDCCADLKVLGRKEFKLLLRWRLKVREKFGFSAKTKKAAAEAEAQAQAREDEEVASVASMDEEMQLQEDLQKMREQNNKATKKDRRKENEKKQKEIVRMQMHMTTPMEIGMEQEGPNSESAMFQLRAADKAGALRQIARGKMHSILPAEAEKQEEEQNEDDSEDEAEDELERDLDGMYQQYQERREDRDTKLRAKKARREHKDEDGEFAGFSDQEGQSSEDEVAPDEDSDFDSEDEGDAAGGSLLTDLDTSAQPKGGLTRRAATFFDQDIFKGIDGLEDAEEDEEEAEVQRGSGVDVDDNSAVIPTKPNKTEQDSNDKVSGENVEGETSDEEDQDTGALDSEDEGKSFEVVKAKPSPWEDAEAEVPLKNGRPDIDIITAEAMTLAHSLATGQKTRHDFADDTFNKYSLRDVDGLPEWFLDDEGKHSRPHRPISAAAASAIKEKLRALNARPIKKVREAKARKQLRAVNRLEKMRKKSALLADSEDVSEKDKAAQIGKIMARAKKGGGKKGQRQEVKVVVARGGNRGRKGRPGGVKGKYKMVDARLKKDARAEKRLKKAGKR